MYSGTGGRRAWIDPAGRDPLIRGWLLWALLLALASPGTAVDRGWIRGQVVRDEGSAVGGVIVALSPGSRAVVSDADGRFTFEGLAAGIYTLSYTLGSNVATEEGVEVAEGSVAEVRTVVDWEYSYSETLTVTAASRRVERVVDAPAAVSVVTPRQIEREAATGQLPKLFESAPGAEITQSGLYDFKFNVRGANTLANRRIAVLIDGRNPSFPLLEAQEWAAVGFPLDDLASAELVRGPSSALYGANAFNGILNLTTKSPSASRGGNIRLAAGELSSLHLDFRIATKLGDGWYFKAFGGYRGSEDFSLSRTETVEYSGPCLTEQTVDCLPLEAVPLPLDRVESVFAGARFDKDLRNGSLVFEGGTAEPKGYVFASASGRFQLVDVKRPWARVNYGAPSWNLLAYYTGREAEAVTLGPGSPSYSDGTRVALEAQMRREVARGRGRLVAGLFASREKVNTADPQGIETLLEEPVEADYRAMFAQFDYDLNDRLKLVVAGRWDDSDLYSGQLSPKASLVAAIRQGHTLRLGYNEAFLSPNYPEFFVRVPLVPPLDLSAFEAFCSPFGVSCGFDRPVPLLGVGNKNLQVEEIRTVEAGYRGIIGSRTFLTLDAFYSEIRDFVRSGVPLVSASLGRANPSFGPYTPPAGLPDPVAATLVSTLQLLPGGLFPFLSNPTPDEPLFPFLTLANVGRVESQGIELNLDHTFEDRWTVEFNYSWLDFDFREELPESPLGLNSPENKLNLGLHYRDDRFAASARYRWVDSFRWTEGIVNGIVPSYEVVNLVATYRVSDSVEIGLNVSNLLDDVHYEVYSGDLMKRRALAHVAYSW